MPPPLRVYAYIAGPPLVTTAAGLNVTLDASGSVCLDGGCSAYVYTVACPGRAAVQLSGNQPSNVVTTGAGTSYSVDMRDLPGGINCSVAVAVTDGIGNSDTASIDLQVRSEGGGAARAQAQAVLCLPRSCRQEVLAAKLSPGEFVTQADAIVDASTTIGHIRHVACTHSHPLHRSHPFAPWPPLR